MKPILLTLLLATGLGLLFFAAIPDAADTAGYLADIHFSQARYTVPEAAGSVLISVTIETTETLTFTVHYSTVDGDATAGQDYLTASGQLTFTPGITLQTFSIEILEDELCEAGDTLYVLLSDPEPGSVTFGLYKTAAVAILNNDPCYVYLPLIRRDPPSAPPEPLTDRLLNPGFESFTTTHQTIYGDDATIVTPEFWITWWEKNEALGMQRPEVRPIPNEGIYIGPPARIHSGYQAMQIFRGWSVYRAGLLQQVTDVPIGATAVFSTYAHAWACQNDPPPALSCNGDYAFHFKVGIDPAGGLDPWSPNMVWSEKSFIYDEYAPVGPVTATVGDAGAVSVFIYAEPTWSLKFVDAYIDDASLIILP